MKKKFMKQCYNCKVDLHWSTFTRDGVSMKCLACSKCKENYFTSSELIRFDILTGRRPLTRKFGVLGNSTIMRIPPKIIKDYKIEPGDYGVFEERPDGILVRLVKAKELKS